MDAKLLFWTGAFANMGVVLALMVAGVRARRRGDVQKHARRMLSAGGLVVGFLLAYAGKLAWLGREDLTVWTVADLWVLRIHELCVATMLLAGGTSVVRALTLRRTRNATQDPGDPPASPGVVRWHRSAGWVAAAGAGLGFATAALVLAGMFRRAGML